MYRAFEGSWDADNICEIFAWAPGRCCNCWALQSFPTPNRVPSETLGPGVAERLCGGDKVWNSVWWRSLFDRCWVRSLYFVLLPILWFFEMSLCCKVSILIKLNLRSYSCHISTVPNSQRLRDSVGCKFNAVVLFASIHKLTNKAPLSLLSSTQIPWCCQLLLHARSCGLDLRLTLFKKSRCPWR